MRASNNFKLKRSSLMVLGAMAVLASAQWAQAGAGWADNTDKAGKPFKQPTFYANSPMGVLPAHGPLDANGNIIPGVSEGSVRDTGTALRKFVDTLPLVDGYVTNQGLLNANAPTAPGRHIPTAIKEVPGPLGHSTSFPDADYYEIAVVEYREQLHSDLPAVKTSINPATGGVITTGGTTLRGYVQIWTPNLPASTPKSQLWRLDGTPVLDNKGQPVFIVGDKPHYLGPIIDSTSGVPVRLRFDNYLPVGHYDPITKTRGGDVFIPTDTTVPGSGLGPLGAADPNAPQPFERYTQNRTNIHLHGGDTPWISDGEPHDWITPAGENTPYKVGETTQNVPDMPDPGPGSQTLYYPNNQSARMMWYHDHSYGSTRIDVYAGIVSAFMIHDATEAAMKTAGGGTVTRANPDGTTTSFSFSGALAGMDEIPLIFEDKTFVPKDIAVEDSKWSTDAWGQYGDLWFPHVYESNQNPNSIDGTNPAGRWDYGPWFWPVFPAPLALPTGEYGNVSATQESFSDTPLINGIAYPNLNVEPKAYRFRLLNASLQRYLNVGFWIAEPLSVAVAANGLNYSTATTVAISADDNGNIPTATLQISPIAAPTVTMTAGGAGYSAATTVTFSPKPGSADAANPLLVNATGHAIIVNGVIQGIVVDTVGSGYTADPVVTITGTGAGALATATFNAGGQIMAIKLNPAPAGVTYSYTKTTPTFTLTDPGKQGSGASFNYSLNTEVPMVDAVMPAVNPAYGPDTYDGRPGGIPDPDQMGPNIIHIGTEGGFLAQPNVITPTPVSYTQLRRIVTVLNVQDHGLYVGPAERADFVVDFSQYAGKTLIFYNDCPAPNPGFDARVDYYTGDPDQTGSGGADVTQPGYGPNTRTIMRVNVAAKQFNGSAPAAPYDPLNNGGPLASDLPKAFAASQDTPIVPESWQNAAYGTQYTDNTAHIYAGSYQQPNLTFNTGGVAQAITGFRLDSAGAGYTKAPTVELTGGVDLTVAGNRAAKAHAVLDVAGKRVQSIVLDDPGVGYTNAPIVALNGGDGLGASATAITSATQSVFVQPKGIQELFEPNYGRMNATFSVELPFTSVLTQTTIPVGYIDPPTDQIADGETQFWKVTHNGVDTHVVHFHLFNVQVINRVAWDGTIVALDPAEYGWKETVKMNPLEDIYVAVRPKTPKQPFGVPQSIRALDPTQPLGATSGFSQVDPKTGLATTVTNQMYNFDWEYVWHCHILGHEENDFMRVVMFNFGTVQPSAVTGVTFDPSTRTVSWIDPTPSGVASTYTDKSNEQGFLVQRSEDGGKTWPALPATTPQSAAQASNNPAGYLPNVTAANATRWVDPIPAGVNTVYRVLGFNSAGYSPTYVATVAGTGAANGSTGTVIQALGTPNAPTQLRGTVGAYANNGGYPVTLTWTAAQQPTAGFVITRQGGFTGNGVAVPDVTFRSSAAPVNGVYSFVDTTAAEVSLYTYTVQADNGNGNLSPGSLALVPTPYAVPPVVNNVQAAVDGNGNTVRISWAMPASTTPDAVNVPASPHLTAFNIQRDTLDASNAVIATSNFGVQQQINPLAGTITLPDAFFVDTTIAPNTSYRYTVVAVNGDKTGTSGATSATTINLKPAAAPGMQGATAIVNSATQITLNWAPPPSNSTVTGVRITRAGGAGPFTTDLTGAVTQYVDSALLASTAYTYSVQWLNNVNGQVQTGNPQTISSVTTAVGAPAPVSGLTVTATPQSAVTSGFTNTLSWTPGANDATFVVSRCLATTANPNCTAAGTVFTSLVQGLTAATFADTTATAGNVYVYQVQALNKDGSQVSAATTVSVYDLPPPAAPATISSVPAKGSVTISWGASTTPATNAYLVQRAVNNGAWSQIATVSGTTLSYQDLAVAQGNTYQYRVYAQLTVAGYPAVNSVNPSATTTVVYDVPAVPVIANPTPTFGLGAGGTPTISFSFAAGTGSAAVASSYSVLRDGAVIASLNAPGTYTDTAPGSTLHTYQVAAVNFLGSSTASVNTVTAQAVVPSAPASATSALVAGSNSRATVSWPAVTTVASAPSVSGYTVTLITNGVAGASVAVPAGTLSYTMTNTAGPFGALTNGNTYAFSVAANSAVGLGRGVTSNALIVGVPAAPATPTTTVAANGVTVSWTASTSQSTTSYNVLRSVNGATASVLGTVAAGQPLTFVDAPSNLVAGNTYRYSIQSVAAAPGATTVTGAASNQATVFYTVPNRPAQLGLVASRPTGATTDSVAVSSITATVPNNAPPVTSYLLELSTSATIATVAQSVTLTPAQAAAGYTFTGVTPGGSAYVRVTAFNVVGPNANTNPRIAGPVRLP